MDCIWRLVFLLRPLRTNSDRIFCMQVSWMRNCVYRSIGMLTVSFRWRLGMIGSLSIAIGLVISPVTIALCRKKSTRLLAVIGGLVTTLGCLFSSFALQFHQMFFSYGNFECVLWLKVHILDILSFVRAFRWRNYRWYWCRHDQRLLNTDDCSVLQKEEGVRWDYNGGGQRVGCCVHVELFQEINRLIRMEVNEMIQNNPLGSRAT